MSQAGGDTIQSTTTTTSGDDDDVIFVSERTPTSDEAEAAERARSLQLPPFFSSSNATTHAPVAVVSAAIRTPSISTQST